MDVFDKYSGDRLGSVPDASAADVHRAVTRASVTAPAWGAVAAHKRSDILRRTAGLLQAKREALAELIARESGKAWRYADAEVARAVETFEFAAEEAKRLHGETVPLMHRPRGGAGRLLSAGAGRSRRRHHAVNSRQPVRTSGAALAAGKRRPKPPIARRHAGRSRRTLADAGCRRVLEVVHGGAPTGSRWCAPGPATISVTGSPGGGASWRSRAQRGRSSWAKTGRHVEPDADLASDQLRHVGSQRRQVCSACRISATSIADTGIERWSKRRKR